MITSLHKALGSAVLQRTSTTAQVLIGAMNHEFQESARLVPVHVEDTCSMRSMLPPQAVAACASSEQSSAEVVDSFLILWGTRTTIRCSALDAVSFPSPFRVCRRLCVS